MQVSIHPMKSRDLLSLQWPTPPRNVLVVSKNNDSRVKAALLEYASHVNDTYPGVSLIFEPDLAKTVHDDLTFPVYALDRNQDRHNSYTDKVDLVTTLGGDGTILHAASLFATAKRVPPVLSFSMGTLGFLGEWKFLEYKRAFREVYVSGLGTNLPARSTDEAPAVSTAGISNDAHSDLHRGKSMGASRSSRILLRNRLKIGIYSSDGKQLPYETVKTSDTGVRDIYALNEVLLHRGAAPHLAHITIMIGSPPNQRILTTAIADGFLISTPTGSTAYSLSSGGSIVHPLVSSLLLTPICPRSLSFRPLVLPANTPVTLRIEEENRGKEIEVSIDGVRRRQGLRAGMEVRVLGEEVSTYGQHGKKDWRGGVPSIVRGASGTGGDPGADHWVGGLNRLLKFNYPFGEDG
ncbi:hypothetical protein AMS68_003943 [Peltaster fructicola]|uniref:NAD+ kinase n=1 Tax=Peltaster fructicola TaxID=286661 RepID=A0A6H0XUR8_9PEZI|nr:hypothetical protein AMS68_003943 [Peltaster fructicola]